MAVDILQGHEFGQKLIDAGFDMPENTTRIVIDIPVDQPITIYYETLASKKTMDVVIEHLMQNKNSIKTKEI